MKKVLRWGLGAVLVLVLAVWFGVPMLLGTGWARERVKAALAGNTGREVEIGSISFGWTSGLALHDVVVKQKPEQGIEEGDLFRLEDLRLRVGFGDLLKKRLNVADLTVEGPAIVIVREKDGTLNISDLLVGESGTAGGAGGEEAPAGDGAKKTSVAARLNIEDGRILFVDRKLGTRVEAEGIGAAARWVDGKLDVDLGCLLNGGEVKLLAQADLAGERKPFEVAEFSISGAELTKDLALLSSFLPLLGEQPDQASGRLTFRLEGLRADGFDLETLKRTLAGSGDVRLEGGLLGGAPTQMMFAALRGLTGGESGSLAALGEGKGIGVDLLESAFTIADGKISTEGLSLAGKGLDLVLRGWTSLTGKLSYAVEAKNLSEELAKHEKVRKILGERNVLPLLLQGSLGAPEVSVDMKGLASGLLERGLDELRDRTGGKLPDGVEKVIPGLK